MLKRFVEDLTTTKGWVSFFVAAGVVFAVAAIAEANGCAFTL